MQDSQTNEATADPAYQYYLDLREQWFSNNYQLQKQLLFNTPFTVEQFNEAVINHRGGHGLFGIGYRYGDLPKKEGSK